MNFVDGLRALLFSIAATTIIYLLLAFTIKDYVKSALITTLILFLFFSYGHVNSLTRNLLIAGQSIGRHRFLIPIYALIFISLILWIIRTKRDLTQVSSFLNILAVFLLLIPVFQITYYFGNEYLTKLDQDNSGSSLIHLSTSNHQPQRDVYYILLDGYPRSDFIDQYLDADNTQFLTDLENRGFFVAHCSQSNYTDTRFTMASTLNMNYLDDDTGLPEVMYPGYKLDNMINTNIVHKNFVDLGYSVITFESGYKWLKWSDTDFHFKPPSPHPRTNFINLGINDFEQLLIDTTAMKAVIDLSVLVDAEYASRLDELVNNPRETHRNRVFYTLDKLGDIPTSIPAPKFVYAHLILPHPPFIVDAHGNPLDNSPADERTAYADQIDFTNTRILEIVDNIISSSETEPIIILQSDHGATLDYELHGIPEENRLGILTAYYLPGISTHKTESSESIYGGIDPLIPTITPVNTFRLIFDLYYNGGLGLLEDKSIVGRQSPFTTIECNLPGQR